MRDVVDVASTAVVDATFGRAVFQFCRRYMVIVVSAGSVSATPFYANNSKFQLSLESYKQHSDIHFSSQLTVLHGEIQTTV